LPQAVVVHVLAGELGKKEVDQVCAAVDEARGAATTRPFILDLAKVWFVPSIGMGVLVGLNREFRGRGQRLIFAGMQADVLRSFTVTQVNRILEIVDDVPAALQSLEK
jgi:anti-anti-sigma factor